LFGAAVVLLGAGVTLFVAAAARALRGMAASNPTLVGLKAGIFGLSVTVVLGLALAVAIGWSLDWPLAQLTDLHLGWGFMAWNGIVLAAVALVVVPMFQITPEYPAWFGRRFVSVALGGVLLWTLADLAGWSWAVLPLAGATLACGAVFCGVTFNVLQRSKRAKHDATHHFWNLSMSSGLLACAVWLTAQVLPAVGGWPRWPLLFGALLLFGGFVSVTIGMLYKIVPFLVWLHLQSRSARRVAAPNMKKVLPQVRIDRQLRSHLASCALLLLSVFWPVCFVYPAGVALIVSNGWLLRNLLHATAVYRNHLITIESAQAKSNPE